MVVAGRFSNQLGDTTELLSRTGLQEGEKAGRMALQLCVTVVEVVATATTATKTGSIVVIVHYNFRDFGNLC